VRGPREFELEKIEQNFTRESRNNFVAQFFLAKPRAAKIYSFYFKFCDPILVFIFMRFVFLVSSFL